MLRAAVETLGQGYVIVDVPSAEEAQLEFRRGPVDLLITDLRLPGISGLELIRKLHKASSEAALIVISGYADETAQAEFRSLGATFFAKPLDLPAFLKGVQAALAGREPAAPAAGQDEASRRHSLPDRLARLHNDLGALAVLLLAGETGSVVAQAGDAAPLKLDLDRLLPMLRQALEASLRVSQALGGAAAGHPPANVQFFEGSACNLYVANVGAAYALLIIFEVQRGAGQMGLVLRYGRQAADDLLNTLRDLGAAGGPLPAEALAAPAAAKPEPGRKKKTGPLRKKTGPLPPPAAAATAPLSAEKVVPSADPSDAPPAKKTTSQAATDFWDGVDSANIGDTRAGTLSWEEAAKLGLIPPKE